MANYPRIQTVAEKKFIGRCLIMSFTDNKTPELWSSFMPRRKEIRHNISNELYSIERYPQSFFTNFDPDASFEKWAAVEVSDFEMIPDRMETLISPYGLYAVFKHVGPASEGPKTYRYIFQTWLPRSDYQLDDRPHFAIMGEKYKKDDPDSEEEIWIPIKPEYV